MSNRYDSAKAYFNSVTGEKHSAFADAADAYYRYVLKNGAPAGSVTWANVTGKPAVIAAGADAASARAAIGAGIPVGAATTTNAGVVKKGVAVANATDSTDAPTQLNALLAALRTAGVIST